MGPNNVVTASKAWNILFFSLVLLLFFSLFFSSFVDAWSTFLCCLKTLALVAIFFFFLPHFFFFHLVFSVFHFFFFLSRFFFFISFFLFFSFNLDFLFPFPQKKPTFPQQNTMAMKPNNQIKNKNDPSFDSLKSFGEQESLFGDMKPQKTLKKMARK